MAVLHMCSNFNSEYSNLMTGVTVNSILLVIFIIVQSLSPVKSQPLNLPAERFPCGSPNRTCERWGYVACVNPDGEFYCLSCDHEYLRTLCGTKEEAQGCNLYCTQKRLEEETSKMREEFSRDMNDMKANFSGFLVHLRSLYLKEYSEIDTDGTEDFVVLQSHVVKRVQDLQSEVEKSHNETNQQKSKAVSLKKDLNEKTLHVKSLEIKLAILLTVAGAVACIIAVYLFCRCRRRRRRYKNGDDIESPEKSSLTAKFKSSNKSVSEYSDESGIEVAIPAVHNQWTQTDKLDEYEKPRGQETKGNSVSKNNKCPGDDCPGYAKLGNIPPTQENGSCELAVSK